MDTEPHPHPPGGNLEEGVVGTGHRAATEGDPERARAVVRGTRDPLDAVEVVPRLGCRAGDLEHDEVPGDPAAAARLTGRRAGDVVGHEDDPGVDALAAQPLLRQREVHDVAGVVPRAEQQAAGSGGRLADGVGVLGGRRGEDVADDGTVREAGADHAAEGGVVAGAPADDDSDLAGRCLDGADDAAGDPHDRAPVHVQKTLEHVVGERVRVVVQTRHGWCPLSRVIGVVAGMRAPAAANVRWFCGLTAAG